MMVDTSHVPTSYPSDDNGRWIWYPSIITVMIGVDDCNNHCDDGGVFYFRIQFGRGLRPSTLSHQQCCALYSLLDTALAGAIEAC